MLHHLRKILLQSFRDELTQDDFRGSTHLTAAPRCVLGLSLVQTEAEANCNGPRKLEVVKTNFGRYPEPLGVDFVPLEPTGVELRYGPVPAKYREPTRGDDCARWLIETLTAAGRPMRPHDLAQLARAQGYSRTTLYRTREDLAGRIVNTGLGHSPASMWSLAENADNEDPA